ncbi:TPA: hypothetical protein ACRMT7_001851 [Pseudomonas aeruginosa]|nr:hypothetical protein [Pseudomonas aeruginosa]
MQTINLEALDILSLEQIEACFIDVAGTVMHCADNHLPIDFVIGMLRTALHVKIEATLLSSLQEMKDASTTGFKPRTIIPPWAQAVVSEKRNRAVKR